MAAKRSSSKKTYEVSWCDVVFLADSFEFTPTELEEAWYGSFKDAAALFQACKSVKPQYEVIDQGSAAKNQEAVAELAFADVAAYLDQQKKIAYTIELKESVYRPGGLGHGGNNRLVSKKNGYPVPPGQYTVGKKKVQIEPLVQVRAGDEV